MTHYVAIAEVAGPDRAVGVWFPDLPGCFSAAQTMGDALVNAPMEHVLKKLPLADELQDALLTHRGPMGEALRSTLAYERGD